jgi:hypothetical protein
VDATYLAQGGFRDGNKFLMGLAVTLFKAETKHLRSSISLQLVKYCLEVATDLVTNGQILDTRSNTL